MRATLYNNYKHGCPYGYLGHPHQRMPLLRLLDRIDIHVEVPRVDYEKLADKRQLQRFTGTKLTCNAEMDPSEVRDFCNVEPSAEKLLKAAMQQLHLSARAFHRVLKLARTIADLADTDLIAANHVAEAIQYRPRVGM